MAWFLDQLVNGLLQLTIAVVVYVANALVQPLGLTPEVALTYFNGIDGFTEAFKILGLFILILIALWSLTKSIFGDGSYGEKDNPAILLLRSGLAIALIFSSMSIMGYAFKVFSQPYYLLSDDSGEIKAFDVVNDEDGVFRNSVSEAFGDFVESAEETSESTYDSALERVTDWIFPGKSILAAIVELICIVIVGYRLILFLLEILERYLLLMLQAFTSPLIWPTIASKGTVNIFKRWFEMFVANFVLMYLNMWMLGLIVRAMGSVFNPDTSIAISGTWTPNFVLGAALIYAMIRIAQALDGHLSRLFSTATTGPSLGQEAFYSIQAMLHSTSRAFSGFRGRMGAGSVTDKSSSNERDNFSSVELDRFDSDSFGSGYSGAGPPVSPDGSGGGGGSTAASAGDGGIPTRMGTGKTVPERVSGKNSVYDGGQTKAENASYKTGMGSQSGQLNGAQSYWSQISNKVGRDAFGEEFMKDHDVSLSKERASKESSGLISGTIDSDNYDSPVAFKQLPSGEGLGVRAYDGKRYELSSLDGDASARQAALNMAELNSFAEPIEVLGEKGEANGKLHEALTQAGLNSQLPERPELESYTLRPETDGSLGVYTSTGTDGSPERIASLMPLVNTEEASTYGTSPLLTDRQGNVYAVVSGSPSENKALPNYSPGLTVPDQNDYEPVEIAGTGNQVLGEMRQSDMATPDYDYSALESYEGGSQVVDIAEADYIEDPEYIDGTASGTYGSPTAVLNDGLQSSDSIPNYNNFEDLKRLLDQSDGGQSLPETYPESVESFSQTQRQALPDYSSRAVTDVQVPRSDAYEEARLSEPDSYGNSYDSLKATVAKLTGSDAFGLGSEKDNVYNDGFNTETGFDSPGQGFSSIGESDFLSYGKDGLETEGNRFSGSQRLNSDTDFSSDNQGFSDYEIIEPDSLEADFQPGEFKDSAQDYSDSSSYSYVGGSDIYPAQSISDSDVSGSLSRVNTASEIPMDLGGYSYNPYMDQVSTELEMTEPVSVPNSTQKVLPEYNPQRTLNIGSRNDSQKVPVFAGNPSGTNAEVQAVKAAPLGDVVYESGEGRPQEFFPAGELKQTRKALNSNDFLIYNNPASKSQLKTPFKPNSESFSEGSEE